MSNEYNFEVEPLIKGYQLLGDSQFVRFAEQLLGKKRRYRDGSAHIGLCVSGQKIGDLLNRVRDNFHPTTSKIVLMIGTNDILRNTNFQDMRDGLNTLIAELLERHVEKIVVLTIPPVPRLANSRRHWERLTNYNEFVKSLDNGYDIVALDICPLFLRTDNCDDGNVSFSNRSSRSFGDDDSSFNNELNNYQDSTESGNTSGNSTGHQSSGMRNIILSSSPYFRSSSVEPSVTDEYSARDEDSSSPATYKNLRISIGVKRKVVELDTDCNDSFSSSPDHKRRSYNNLAVDDHNDNFYEGDSYSEDHPKFHIRSDCFEEYFSGGNKRQDLIHLNRKGLSLVKYELYKLIG